MHVKTIYENVLDIVLEHVDEVVDANQPNVAFENDGIGPYEAWGQKGFDHGKTYPIIDDEPLERVIIQAVGFSARLLRKVAADILIYEYASHTDVRLCGQEDDHVIRCMYKVAGTRVINHDIVVSIEWGDVEEQ